MHTVNAPFKNANYAFLIVPTTSKLGNPQP